MTRHPLATLLTLLLATTAPAWADDASDAELWPGGAQQLQAARAGHPQPGTLVLRTPEGRPAYLLTAPCCDLFNPLYDHKGRKLCAPNGGFAGHGDGRCPAWVPAAIAEAQRKALTTPRPEPAASTIRP